MKNLSPQQLTMARTNQILDAAAEVFAEKGFHPTTIHDIARRAGIADGTIYNYFDDKTALLVGIFERMKASIVQEVKLPPPGEMDFHTFLSTFLRLPLTAFQENNFALFRIVLAEMMVNEELRAMYYQQILQPTLALPEVFFQEYAREHGLSTLQVRLLIRAISGMMLGLTLEYIMGDPILKAEWDTLPDFVTNLIFNGLDNQAESRS